ncbi:hypothetical protein [Pseudonocardia lacus]|uniref:hypothetical protein n=1 Tax=Pseudonocardia lacus TaxID=2835865 RepID=UPI001BDD91DD|nr:hypothetical protein [Pseudonocardia lacus]
METASTPAPAPTSRRRLGLPVPAVIGLALLAAPRVVLHDLGLVTEGSAVNAALVFVPPAVWVAVVLLTRAAHPFRTLLAVGAAYGVLLAAIHQVLWHVQFPDGSPLPGGNLAGTSPVLGELLVRGAAVLSSLVTGVVVGAVAGAVAWLIRRAAGHRLS